MTVYNNPITVLSVNFEKETGPKIMEIKLPKNASLSFFEQDIKRFLKDLGFHTFDHYELWNHGACVYYWREAETIEVYFS